MQYLPPPQIYTYEMKIIKAVAGDSGGYRCEVTAKDKCDSCTFEIEIQGEWRRTLGSLLRADVLCIWP